MKYIKHLFLLFIAANLFIGCNKNNDNTVSGDNLQTTLASKSDLSIFSAAMTKAKLDYFLNGPGPFTVFAPNNAAFNAAGIMSVADLNLIDTNTLATILTYHFQTGLRTSFEIPNGPNANINTQGGFPFYSSKNANGIFINGNQLVSKDIRASNGIIHIINGLLLPPVNNALNALTLNTNLKLYVQAINKTASTASFTTGLVTVFAPTNAAMTAGGYDSTTIANLSATGITTLTNIIKYHIVPSRLYSSEFKDIAYKTLQGTNFTLSSNGTMIKGTTNAAAFNISLKNIAVSNGVIHVIDGLLKY